MDSFPTEDEEFELMYGDELELLREQEDNYESQLAITAKSGNAKSKDSVQPSTSKSSSNNCFPTEEEELDFISSKGPAAANGTCNKNGQKPTDRSYISTDNDRRQLIVQKQNDRFPTEEEEFDLMHSDDLELLNEQDVGERVPKSRKVLNFNKPPQNVNIHDSSQDITPIIQENDTSQSSTSIPANGGTNKRTIEELFGDIDDLLSEDVTRNYQSTSKRRKKDDRENSDLALIEYILTLRKLSSESNNPVRNFAKDYTSVANRNRENVSCTVPKYPFMAVNNHNGERIYVRFHSEAYEKEEMERVTDRRNFAGIMGEAFKDIWIEATDHINRAFNLAEEEEIEEMEVGDMSTDIQNNKSLWVDLYKPRKYFELLSDESTNRILLRWLKLWDKVVFNIRPKLRPVKTNEKFADNKFKRQELSLELDEQGRPGYKVALLCGPPGLGKTTLAHMVAKHAGYNVVEINASDDRNLDSFKTALENATSMCSVLDKEKRPNCLIFDEIDGAPATSIDFLIKFINGNHIVKAKKGKNATKHILKRPIICICNDVYVPALRSLRQIAFVVNFPPTSSARLAERLCEIARKEQVKTDTAAVLALAEKSHNDIRSCLSFLHFFKSQNRPVTLSDVMKTSVGEKDVQKGLFSVWNDIFQIQRIVNKDTDDKKHIDVSLRTRMSKVLHTVNSFGDFDRVMQGVFENYPKMRVKDSSLKGTCEALDWFCLNDTLNKHVMAKQDYSLATYLPYGFVVWHFVFASMNWQKITYPNMNYEIRTKRTKNRSISSELTRGMRPSIRAYISPVSFKMDIVPYLNQIIIPNLRPVNLHLYTQHEKDQLSEVVNTMIDYNLNYVQERTLEGSYAYNLDPNLEELVSFPGFKPKKVLTYANRQLIAREIELEKMRVVESQRKEMEKNEKKKVEKAKEPTTKECLPNHLKTLQPKNVKTNATDSFKECLDKIIDEDGMDSVTISEASGLLKHLNCPEFLYWLKIFHSIMPHVEIFFNQTQTRGIESAQMQKAFEQFQQQIIRIRNSTDNNNNNEERNNEEPARKRQKATPGDYRAVIAKEVCDTILSQIIDRFNFRDHLSAAKLFDSQNLKTYRHAFPQKHFDETVKSYPMLDSVKLKSELLAIYERGDMCDVSGILPFLVFKTYSNLKKVLTEIYKLLDIICTTPMSTVECERCFSTLKRIKTFLRNTMSEDRLNALAVLSIEKKFVQSIPDLDNKVIDIFSGFKDRRMDFMYKD